MPSAKFSLDLIDVPEPCAVPWEAMTGDDRVRHCARCDKSVYQLSNMSRAAAEALIIAKEGKLCVQFYRRADGTVVTQDCAAVRWARRAVSLVTATCVAALSVFGVARVFQEEEKTQTFSFVGGAIAPPKFQYPAQPKTDTETPEPAK